MTEHAEVAGELVRDSHGFGTPCFIKRSRGGMQSDHVDRIQTVARRREMALPQVGEQRADLGFCLSCAHMLIRRKLAGKAPVQNKIVANFCKEDCKVGMMVWHAICLVYATFVTARGQN